MRANAEDLLANVLLAAHGEYPRETIIVVAAALAALHEREQYQRRACDHLRQRLKMERLSRKAIESGAQEVEA